MENQNSRGRKAIIEQELLRGRDMANQLLEVLVAHNNKSNNHHYLNRSYDDDKGLMVLLPYAEDLVHQVLRSFTNSLLILNTTTTTKSDAIDHDVFSDGRVVFDSTKFRDFSSTTSSPSLHHTNNNRLRKSSVPTWEKDSPILIEDGHEWRKYGQKMTMNSKYLRNYYRCSHKNDQGCPATKKVQQIQDNPPLFRTSYYGHHICKSITYNEETILESESFSESSMFLSFNNNNNNNNNSNVIITPSKEHQFSSSQAFESKNFISQNQLLLSSSDYYHPLCVYEELGFDYSRHHDPMLYSTDEKVQFDNNALGWDLLDYDGLACYGQQI
ncbi:uncharacterized protein [Arachis hypogaea]|uniref:uncharacterized protein n=1 Tax=Arachis hypogaea TaxID=3818 RepID=UPI0034E7C566